MNKHAFLIIAHNEPKILSVLLKQLDYPSFDVYLHIDAKATDIQKEFEKYKPRYGSFKMLSQHIDVRWGSISQVEVEMLLLKEAFQNGPYVYYHIISGVDLLLKKPETICRLLSAQPNKEYVSFWQSSSHKRDLRRKVERMYLFTNHLKDKGTLVHAITAFIRNTSLAIQKAIGYHRTPPNNITFYKGSNWASITESFCQYVLQEEPKIHTYLTHTLCPDEIFLQTLLYNSPFKRNIYQLGTEDTQPSSLRKIDWQRGSPYTWTNNDITELLQSEALFARKFSSQNIEVVKAIDQSIKRNQ